LITTETGMTFLGNVARLNQVVEAADEAAWGIEEEGE
jgi:hypothetical protein